MIDWQGTPYNSQQGHHTGGEEDGVQGGHTEIRDCLPVWRPLLRY